MSVLITTCRFCQKTNFEAPNLMMLKYGVRHWAHLICAIEHIGATDFLEKLSPYQKSKIDLKETLSALECRRAAWLRSLEVTGSRKGKNQLHRTIEKIEHAILILPDRILGEESTR